MSACQTTNLTVQHAPTEDFLHIDDAIKAILLSIRNKNIVGKIVNIGSGNPIRLKDIIFR